MELTILCRDLLSQNGNHGTILRCLFATSRLFSNNSCRAALCASIVPLLCPHHLCTVFFPPYSPTHCHSLTLLSASLFLNSTDERAYPWQLDRGGDWRGKKAGSRLLLYMAGAVCSGSLSFQPPRARGGLKW